MTYLDKEIDHKEDTEISFSSQHNTISRERKG